MSRALTIGLAAVLAACGGDDSPTQSDAAVVDGENPLDCVCLDTQAGPFTLTSTVLAAGGMFAAANTCDGANTSPDLAWTGAPSTVQSYAVVLTDKSNALVHWVIYDIPAADAALPAAVMKAYSPSNVPGAHQTASYQAAVTGYLGPCPPMNQGPHTYEHALYALDVATLPGASSTTTRAQAVATIMQHVIASTTLTATYAR